MSKQNSQKRLNYDLIAHLYDEPLRDHPADEFLFSYLKENDLLKTEEIRVLDMGCGTGKQLASNRELFHKTILAGLDLSIGMLKQARKRCGNVFWVQGDSSRTPFKSDSFYYISNQFSYPHVADKNSMLAETHRLLKRGGKFVMKNIDPWNMEKWILYKYFPEALEMDFRDFLPVEKFIELLKVNGFANIQMSRQQLNDEENLQHFFNYVSQRFRTSHLMAITDEMYNYGLLRIRQDIDRGYSNIKSEFCLITITGDKLAVI
jgi:ubiquinone/menaquinone biosynthesis C-methylase UbiE